VKYIVSVAGREIEVEVDGDLVTVDGSTRTASLRALPGSQTRQLLIEGQSTALTMRSTGRGQWSLEIGGDRWEVEVVDERTRHIRSLTAGAERQPGPVILRAPMPGLVVRVLVEPGQEVAAGAGLVVLEAMKMENELKAPAPGTVGAIRTQAGQAVEKGQVLLEFQ
jgi:biotin carboxyl carrier protein